MKYFFVLAIVFVAFGAGCSSKPQGGAAPTGGRPIVSDADNPDGTCTQLTGKNGQPIFTESDAVSLFGGTWKLQWLSTSEYSCWYGVDQGKYGEPGNRSISLQAGVFSVQSLRAMAGGKADRYGLEVETVAGLGSEAFVTIAPSKKITVFIVKNDNAVAVWSTIGATLDDLKAVASTAAKKMR